MGQSPVQFKRNTCLFGYTHTHTHTHHTPHTHTKTSKCLVHVIEPFCSGTMNQYVHSNQYRNKKRRVVNINSYNHHVVHTHTNKKQNKKTLTSQVEHVKQYSSVLRGSKHDCLLNYCNQDLWMLSDNTEKVHVMVHTFPLGIVFISRW